MSTMITVLNVRRPPKRSVAQERLRPDLDTVRGEDALSAEPDWRYRLRRRLHRGVCRRSPVTALERGAMPAGRYSDRERDAGIRYCRARRPIQRSLEDVEALLQDDSRRGRHAPCGPTIRDRSLFGERRRRASTLRASKRFDRRGRTGGSEARRKPWCRSSANAVPRALRQRSKLILHARRAVRTFRRVLRPVSIGDETDVRHRRRRRRFDNAAEHACCAAGERLSAGSTGMR